MGNAIFPRFDLYARRPVDVIYSAMGGEGGGLMATFEELAVVWRYIIARD